MSNIMVIYPYWQDGNWVFKDAEKGIDKDFFIAGADTVIAEMVEEIPDAKKGFRLLFSDLEFPDWQKKLVWREKEYKGNKYADSATGYEGYLSPNLLNYFKVVPKVIFAKAEKL